MAAPRSRLAAVLRAGQAQLAATGGGLVRAKELLKKKRRKERAEELYAQCIREMTEAQETYKGRMGAAKLAEWERKGLVFPDPVAIAELVYDCVMRDEEADALYYIQHNVERSLQPPQAVEDQERAREAAREVRRRLRSADDENEGDENEGGVTILDAWECADECGGGGGDDSDSNATVEYGASSDDEVAAGRRHRTLRTAGLQLLTHALPDANHALLAQLTTCTGMLTFVQFCAFCIPGAPVVRCLRAPRRRACAVPRWPAGRPLLRPVDARPAARHAVCVRA